MDRRSFLKELVQSLTDTGKEIVYPLFENDIDKLERAADVLTGVSWMRLESIEPGYQEQICAGRIISLYLAADRLIACSKICPDCHETLQWIAYDRRLTCTACGRSYTFSDSEDSLRPNTFSVKKEEGSWWVALPDKGVPTDA
ncbi:Rieske (2Fe-2S) protein [Sporolactobacillus shoreae]|uniref:Rieske (2Fe-2S) protein n=1 Tax=Sporolactobacillus shoreae TaxID=1465501 RepID=A0A4Z0GKB9_9BACL|nr:Rieske (2Fe-2S) protein [Sporolactobacillus shoreae]TGA97359.1 Rieske (2Fe-2S) protein [Sporolactobacillus shoreae]